MRHQFSDCPAGFLVVEVAVADELADDGCARDDVDIHHRQEVVQEADQPARLGVFRNRVDVRRNGYVESTSPLIVLNGSNFSWSTTLQIPGESYVRVDVVYGNGTTWNSVCLVNPVFINTD